MLISEMILMANTFTVVAPLMLKVWSKPNKTRDYLKKPL